MHLLFWSHHVQQFFNTLHLINFKKNSALNFKFSTAVQNILDTLDNRDLSYDY